jgi:hypothetical protein
MSHILCLLLIGLKLVHAAQSAVLLKNSAILPINVSNTKRILIYGRPAPSKWFPAGRSDAPWCIAMPLNRLSSRKDLLSTDKSGFVWMIVLTFAVGALRRLLEAQAAILCALRLHGVLFMQDRLHLRLCTCTQVGLTMH